jgi:phosphoribosylamine--glycine ligase
MRILGIGDYLDLGDMYLRLAASGHEVRVHVADPAYHGVMAGLVRRVPDWRAELPWIAAAGQDGVILFESAGRGHEQDALRAAGHQVIGGCAWGDRLEGDRAFGQEIMRAAGMRTAAVHDFTDFSAAISFVQARPRRYVCKHNGHHLPSTRNYVGALYDGADIIQLLRGYARAWPADLPVSFVLMDHLEGVETGVGAYFDGAGFVGPACLDWEHKRFFPGDLGELTGEMGTVVTYEGSGRLFAETLAPLAPRMRAAGYRGYINLNCIINEDGVWPLEYTCRFGYPGFAILDALQPGGWDEVLGAMLGRGGFTAAPGYAVGVVLTTPPFPYAGDASCCAEGLPVSFRGELSPAERAHLHYAEVALDAGGALVTSGASGYVLVATGCGADVAAAQTASYGLLGKVVVPNARWRVDIGDRLRDGDLARLGRLGYGAAAPVPPHSARR